MRRARARDREAIREVCGIADKSLRFLATTQALGDSESIKFVADALEFIVREKCPNEAFFGGKEKHGRPTTGRTKEKGAVRELCRLAMDGLKVGAGRTFRLDDELIQFIVETLALIAEGVDPDEAFRWPQTGRGKPLPNHALRDWYIKMLVRDHMAMAGAGTRMTVKRACREILEMGVVNDQKALLKISKNDMERICKGLTPSTSVQLPDEIFPFKDSLETCFTRDGLNYGRAEAGDDGAAGKGD